MPGRTGPATLLDPRVLATIGDLELLARTVIDGFLHGLHRSSRSGLSVDFAEHRSYQPGDDLRRLDWRVYARTDRLYLKTFEAETNADLHLVLDRSGSMGFGSGAMTKLEWGKALLASLGWLASSQGDRVGYLPIGSDGGDAERVPAAPGRLPHVLHALGRTAADGTLPPGTVLDRLAAVQIRAGMMAIVSDCYDDAAAIIRGAGALRVRGHDVMIFHVVDPVEADFPYEDAATLADMETAARLAIRPGEIREAYRSAFLAHQQELRAGLGREGIDYRVLRIDQPLDAGLRAWLDERRTVTGLR